MRYWAWFAAGHKNAEIANRLALSEKKVRKQVSHIMSKIAGNTPEPGDLAGEGRGSDSRECSLQKD